MYGSYGEDLRALVALHLAQRVKLFDSISWLDQPLHHADLGDPLTDVGQLEWLI